MVGGYCDAGDSVKFGFPMALTTTMLLWSVIEFGGMMKGVIELSGQPDTTCRPDEFGQFNSEKCMN